MKLGALFFGRSSLCWETLEFPGQELLGHSFFLFCFKEIEPPAAPWSLLARFYGGPGINFGGQIQVLRPTAVSSQEAHPLPTVALAVLNSPWGLGPHLALEARMGKEAEPSGKVGEA